MNYLSLFLLIFILLIILHNYYNRYSGLTSIQCPTDGRKYMVKNDNNKYFKVKLLSKINEITLNILNKLKQSEHYNNKGVKKLCSTYNPNKLYENVDKEYTSYSLNKGEEIRLCLVNPEDNSVIEDINTLLFVLIHELAHIMTPAIGHPPEFFFIVFV